MKVARTGWRNIALIAALVLSGHHAIAQTSGKTRASPVEGVMLVQVIGEVRAVDLTARRVSVVDAQGRVTQLNVGQDVHDLDKLPLGTRIKSTALQPVTLAIAKSARPDSMIPGDKQFVARVASVDATAGVVMLKDADNLPIEVRTRAPGAAATFSEGATVQVRLANKTARNGAATPH